MEEWIKKSDVLELLSLPTDIFLADYIYELKGVWVDEDWNRWNPISEGLPKENGEYLCQINFGNHKLFEVLSFSTNLYEVNEYDFCDINRAGFYDFDSEWGYNEVHNVVAWQLLPEAYKE